MTEEENFYYEKIKQMKRENELLMVIFEEVDDLVKMGYDGPFMGEEVRGIFFAVNEYKKWKKNEQNREKAANS